MIITYISSNGSAFNLTTGNFIHREANYHKWTYTPKTAQKTYGERVSYFQRKALEYKTTLIIQGGVTQRQAILTALHDAFEYDIRTMQLGKLIYGNSWYANCFITESATEPMEFDHWTENKVTIYVPEGFWLREESNTFKSTASDVVYTYLDYPYDYPYDFRGSNYNAASWSTDSMFESEFRMEIHGPCVNPRITINGYPYVVYATIQSGETLVIDSTAKTVMCGDENLFDARNKAQSVFQRIPSGGLTLSWGDFDFTLTLYEERSEPKWS